MALSERIGPKQFLENMRSTCLSNVQHIVLPEGNDKRVLEAAAELSHHGLAKITILGEPKAVIALAQKSGLDISLCDIIEPKSSKNLDKYTDYLAAVQKKKKGAAEKPRAKVVEEILKDVNMFGTLMVVTGDADGMVSGAVHTTAATIKPALQVLKPAGGLVSSVFFMCLEDRVLVYGDCAINIRPSSQQLSQIAVQSAGTAKAFGLEPLVAMLSFSTMGSGTGPEVDRVAEAEAGARKLAPQLAIEGPIQYDAAIDPEVAAQKVKRPSKVAGKANVFVFPDLNAGNNAYKAVQQATKSIAIGPVIQGLNKPVNDLSRGCTVADIINTVCITSVQAIQSKEATQSKL